MPPLGKERFEPTPKTEAELAIERKLAQTKQVAAQKAFGLIEGIIVLDYLTLPSSPYPVEDQTEDMLVQAWITANYTQGRTNILLSTRYYDEDSPPTRPSSNYQIAFDDFGNVPRVAELRSEYEDFSPAQKLEFLEAVVETLDQFLTD